MQSVKDILGSTLVTSNGQRIGKLGDVLFDQNGSFVRSAYLKINFRTIRDKGVAVPYNILKFEVKNGKMQTIIPQGFADLIISHAEKG